MNCHGSKETVTTSTEEGPIVLVGNPNVGKSVLFGLLTRRYVTVSNYPGTTVEVARGAASVDGLREVVIDTPGVNNLLAPGECERVTRDILMHERPSAAGPWPPGPAPWPDRHACRASPPPTTRRLSRRSSRS